MPDDPKEKKIEAPKETGSKPSDTVANQAQEGKQDLVKAQITRTEFLKAGGKSGISAQFGKVELFDQVAKNEKITPAGLSLDTSSAAPVVDKKHGRHVPPDKHGSTDEAGTKRGKAVQDGHGKKDTSDGGRVSGGGAGTDKGHKDKVVLKEGDGIGKGKDLGAKVESPIPLKDYKGEGIQLYIQPSIKFANTGDTLESIAKTRLPANATKDQLHAYQKEIAIVNGLNPSRPGDLSGKILNLPGSTSDGGMIVKDIDGKSRITWKNGNITQSDQEGHLYTKVSDGKGGFLESNSGPRKIDSFQITKTPDGKILLADKIGDKPREVPPASEEVKTERQKLMDLSEKKIDDPAKKAKFQADMLKFEDRAAKQDPPLSAEEIAKTYKQMERLLSATGDTPLSQADKVKIAEQAMSQAATPSSIDQGQHPTCNVAVEEVKTYIRHPSDAVKLVTDVATTGEYTAPDGTHVKIDPKAADREAKGDPSKDGDRSHASQIFQDTAINLHYQKEPYTYTNEKGEMKTVPPGMLEYKHVPDVPGALPPQSGGDRLFDNSTNPPTMIMKDWAKKIPEDAPGIATEKLPLIANRITGQKDSVVLENDLYAKPTESERTFKSEAEFRKTLEDAADQHKFPMSMLVHSGQEPFLHDSGGGTAGGSGGWHVVTLTGYDKATGKVQVDNQWGEKGDHLGDKGMNVHDLYRASIAPGHTIAEQEVIKQPWYKFWKSDEIKYHAVNVTIRDLQKEVDQDRAGNTVDNSKELDLLRLKHQYGGMNDDDCEKGIRKAIDDATARWEKQKKDGTFDQKEYDNTMQKLKETYSYLPPDKQLGVVKEMYDKKMLDAPSYSWELRLSSWRLFHDDKKDVSDAQTEQFMSQLKAATDSLPEDQRRRVVSSISFDEQPGRRFQMAEFERKQGLIDDKSYDAIIADSTKDFLRAPRTSEETAAFTARLWRVMGGLPEDRRLAILKQIPELKPPKAP